ncbi:MAG: methylated-DNA--[protein]-cysteine S-methyltransferase [Candidatus Sericytochromatia bacterium]|nr:methylated-DNA--[protein]-cysteine S-methyltransferase [Candidatus Sericytochromatia bacterium]
MTCHTIMTSPLGEVVLTSDGTSLIGVYFPEHTHGPAQAARGPRQDDAAPFPAARLQLAAYFAGTRTAFELPLAGMGTPFQQRVWAGLMTIPFGETMSYGELAGRIGNANASRAVGLANGRNPLSIIVPCHRVIGANGTLVGYGGGLDRKQRLLALEAAVYNARPPALQQLTPPGPQDAG